MSLKVPQTFELTFCRNSCPLKGILLIRKQEFCCVKDRIVSFFFWGGIVLGLFHKQSGKQGHTLWSIQKSQKAGSELLGKLKVAGVCNSVTS